jgi:pimeloyl-ACP methyl ester carboxylesterase
VYRAVTGSSRRNPPALASSGTRPGPEYQGWAGSQEASRSSLAGLIVVSWMVAMPDRVPLLPRLPIAGYARPVTLAYDEAGAGECVVLIHGHPFDRTLWRPQLTALRDGMGVLVDYMHTGLYGPACPPAVRARIDAMMFAASPAGAAAALRGRAERPDYRPLLAGLDIPAFVCTGSADPWSNAAVTAEILGCLKNPASLVIEGAGHLPNLEAEAEFNAALSAFLRACAPR